MGWSSVNRRRSSASSVALWYRRAGSLSIAFKTIVSRSRAMRESMARGGFGSSLLICSINCRRSSRLERRPQGEQLIERQAQGVDVGPRVGVASEPLRCHVSDCPDDGAGVGQIARIVLGQTEIGQPDDPLVSSSRFDGLMSRWTIPRAWA